MDQILYWNDVALEANRIGHTNGKGEQTGPPLGARALSIVHLAMYDTYAAVSGNPSELPPYLPDLPAPPEGASLDAAVAAAAHSTLAKLFPSKKAFFEEKHLQAGLTGTGLNEGHQFGLMVAQRMLDDRKDDPGTSDEGYAVSMARGAHRVDPDNPEQGYDAPFLGANTKCFAATDRHEWDPPPGLETHEYKRALREARAKGIAPELTGSVQSRFRRTVDETLIGIYWPYDGSFGLGTPPRLCNQIIRTIAIAKENTPAQNARLFALVNVAMADAGILAWEQKLSAFPQDGGEMTAKIASHLVPFAVAIGFIAGFTLDAVFRKLAGMDVVHTEAVEVKKM